MTVTGPKRVGKTTFIRELLKKCLLDEFEYVVVMTPTGQLSGDFDFLDEQRKAKYIVNTDPSDFEDMALQLFQKQEELQLKNKQAPRTLVILDDCATNKILRERSVLDKYIIRHRHAQLSFLIVGHSLRGVCGLPKSIRMQIDYNIIFNPASMSELETILKEAILPVHLKGTKERVVAAFQQPYNYIVYQPAERYSHRLLLNWKKPMIYLPGNSNEKSRRKKQKVEKEIDCSEI